MALPTSLVGLLLEVRDETDRQVLIQELEKCIDNLKKGDRELFAALNSLRKVPERWVLQLYEKYFLKDERAGGELMLRWGLEHHAHPNFSIEPFLSHLPLLTAQQDRVLDDLLFSLLQRTHALDSQRLTELLRSALKHQQGPLMIFLLEYAYRERIAPEAEFLERFARQGPHFLRPRALKLYGRVRYPNAYGLLLERALSPRFTTEERQAAIKALSELGDQRAVTFLLRLIDDPKESIRLESIDALKHFPLTVEQRNQLYERFWLPYSNEALRYRLAELLLLRDPSEIDSVKALKIVAWLSTTQKDSRLLEYLVKHDVIAPACIQATDIELAAQGFLNTKSNSWYVWVEYLVEKARPERFKNAQSMVSLLCEHLDDFRSSEVIRLLAHFPELVRENLSKLAQHIKYGEKPVVNAVARLLEAIGEPPELTRNLWALFRAKPTNEQLPRGIFEAAGTSSKLGIELVKKIPTTRFDDIAYILERLAPSNIGKTGEALIEAVLSYSCNRSLARIYLDKLQNENLPVKEKLQRLEAINPYNVKEIYTSLSLVERIWLYHRFARKNSHLSLPTLTPAETLEKVRLFDGRVHELLVWTSFSGNDLLARQLAAMDNATVERLGLAALTMIPESKWAEVYNNSPQETLRKAISELHSIICNRSEGIEILLREGDGWPLLLGRGGAWRPALPLWLPTLLEQPEHFCLVVDAALRREAPTREISDEALEQRLLAVGESVRFLLAHREELARRAFRVEFSSEQPGSQPLALQGFSIDFAAPSLAYGLPTVTLHFAERFTLEVPFDTYSGTNLLLAYLDEEQVQALRDLAHQTLAQQVEPAGEKEKQFFAEALATCMADDRLLAPRGLATGELIAPNRLCSSSSYIETVREQLLSAWKEKWPALTTEQLASCLDSLERTRQRMQEAKARETAPGSITISMG